MTNWLMRIAAAVEREYDRRIRRASLVDAYGAPHGHCEDEDEDGVEIANVARGSLVVRAPAEDEDEDGVEIANVARGSLLAPPPAPRVTPGPAETPAAVDTALAAPAGSASASGAAAEAAALSSDPTAAPDDDDNEVEISNLPPGAAPRP